MSDNNDNDNDNDNGNGTETETSVREYDPARNLDTYPNLLEKACDEDERLIALKRALHYVREAMEEYPRNESLRIGPDERQYERLETALTELQDATSARRGSIATTLASVHTRNPNYDNYNPETGTFVDESHFTLSRVSPNIHFGEPEGDDDE